MKKTFFLLLLAQSCITYAYPTLQHLPKEEKGKAAVIIYSSSLHTTASFDFFINMEKAGRIDGDEVKLVYLAPGSYDITVKVPNIGDPLNKYLKVQAGKYYFLNAYSTTSGTRTKQITYRLDSVTEQAAMAYLRDEEKNKYNWLFKI